MMKRHQHATYSIVLLPHLAHFVLGGKMHARDNHESTSVAFDIVNIENDTSNSSCVFVTTSFHRFHLCNSVEANCYVVMDVQELKCTNGSPISGLRSKYEIAKHFVKEHPIKVAVVGLPLVVAGAGTAATAAGFGAAGIVGGSIAAALQSSIGNVVAGSWFATMQSLGMTGTFTAMTTGGIGASATGAAALAATSKNDPKKQKEDDSVKNTETGSKSELFVDIPNFVFMNAEIVNTTSLIIHLKD